jgi:hypothetical protein
VLRKLQVRYPWLKKPFEGSIFPTLSVNFGPRSVLSGHRNHLNAAGVPCAITALGSYNPVRGGHIILFEYGLVIEFLPTSTIYILSGCVRHANTKLQPDETRFSMIQYMPVGLWRHVAYGFRVTRDLTPAEEAEVAQTAPTRLQQVLSMLSTIGSVVQNCLALKSK